MQTSVLELFRIGIGPSSSHTVGPMRAARAFATGLQAGALLPRVAAVRVELYGSLALTGLGHGTDRAILLGLTGAAPETVDPAGVESIVAAIRARSLLPLLGKHEVVYRESGHLLWRRGETLPQHSNGMRFSAFDASGALLAREDWYSTGGGFVLREGQAPDAAQAEIALPHPYASALELLERARAAQLPLWALVAANEAARHGAEQVAATIDRLWSVMSACIERGLHTEGILPGGLKVRRRAPRLYARLQKQVGGDSLSGMDWVNAFAMAVNEENAAGGRVVTAPTNGAAGVIPAVLRYYEQFVPGASRAGIQRFFLAAGGIGVLYKDNASISGAEVGCQGEVGVACSMAAAGLVAALEGSNEEIEHAAEIGMEHHLGMTCDPIGGLVQIPCIERNAVGAIKAIAACRMAMLESGDHKVSLDQVIRTMFQTGRDMQSRYKETSLGGLAVNVTEC